MSIREFLVRTETPIWWNIVTALFSGFLGALFVTLIIPYFNSDFENSKIRTAFILTKISQLDSSSNEVAVLGNRYIQACYTQAEGISDTSREFQEAKFKMDLRSVEVMAMLANKKDRAHLAAMQENLGSIQFGLECPSSADLSEYSNKLIAFKADVLHVLRALTSSANL